MTRCLERHERTEKHDITGSYNTISAQEINVLCISCYHIDYSNAQNLSPIYQQEDPKYSNVYVGLQKELRVKGVSDVLTIVYQSAVHFSCVKFIYISLHGLHLPSIFISTRK